MRSERRRRIHSALERTPDDLLPRDVVIVSELDVAIERALSDRRPERAFAALVAENDLERGAFAAAVHRNLERYEQFGLRHAVTLLRKIADRLDGNCFSNERLLPAQFRVSHAGVRAAASRGFPHQHLAIWTHQEDLLFAHGDPRALAWLQRTQLEDAEDALLSSVRRGATHLTVVQIARGIIRVAVHRNAPPEVFGFGTDAPERVELRGGATMTSHPRSPRDWVVLRVPPFTPRAELERAIRQGVSPDSLLDTLFARADEVLDEERRAGRFAHWVCALVALGRNGPI